jgi:O-acetyl-ADP-ribose deacetylase (regulator of RNase III)
VRSWWRVARKTQNRKGISWSNPSVLALAEGGDPVATVLEKAEEAVLEARELGWNGPPFDPFALADLWRVKVVPVDEIEEARLVHVGKSPIIEYNPTRSAARVRFSVAHELAHLLFPDASEKVRYRAHGRDRRPDDWQLEMLCNLAAAEFLMPVGSFPPAEAEELDINRLMTLAQHYDVSAESLLLRVVRLTSQAAAVFVAARQGPDEPTYRIDYRVSGRAWDAPFEPYSTIRGAPVAECTAIGYTAKGELRWAGETLHVECVGVPPYPGNRYPRVVGVVRPMTGVSPVPGITYVHGNAAEPRGEGPRILAHVVNDRAKRWGGLGLARDLKQAFPHAHEAYLDWQQGRRHLGQCHFTELEDGLLLCSMVAQRNYGADKRQRLSYVHLRLCLAELATRADEDQAGVQMPLIGTGQAGGDWATIRDLVLEQLTAKGISVTVYVLPGAELPNESAEPLALSA